MNNEDQSASAYKQNSGFFQVSLADLHLITKRDGGVNEMAAYLVLCSGVNGRHHERLCTHGAQSISKRTGMSYRAAERAAAWLLDEGFIRRASPDTHGHLGKVATRSTRVRWIVCDIARQPDVAISRLFVDGVKGSHKDAPIKRMLTEITGGERFTRAQSVMDAMMTFVALMKEQDFGDCAGVDPDAWWQSFDPIEPGEGGDGAEHIELVPHTNGVMVTVKEAGDRLSSWSFIFQALGEAAADEAQRQTLSARFWHAIDQLRSLQLIYRVLILWSGNPLDPRQRRKAEPLATHYINDAWARKIDPHLQYAVHRAIWRTIPGFSEADFGSGNEGAIPFVRSGRYRYIVRADQEKNTHLVGQLRVRYWPANASTIQGRDREATRTARWLGSISSI
jgi:hypothetical protein